MSDEDTRRRPRRSVSKMQAAILVVGLARLLVALIKG
ncbi:hypothetical protein C8E83_2262 [Frondihabitans australicus]|uniref:Uncharacterized protein n=1 Tax=Frondihabitans australicus TaxID=386892 RepID=A0A495IJ21_9MICO|nr:hypothetical protein C8E83_2262 [Frondihabitans australicus]